MINNRKNGGKIDFACAAGAHTQQNAGRRGNLMIVSCFNIQTLSSWAPLKNRFSLLLLVVVAVDFQLLIINCRWTVSIERTRTLLLQHYQVELIRGRFFSSFFLSPPLRLLLECVFFVPNVQSFWFCCLRAYLEIGSHKERWYTTIEENIITRATSMTLCIERKKERKESTTSWRCLHLAFLKEEDSRRRVLWQQKDDWPFDYILLWRLLYSFVWAETNQLTSRSYSWTLNACVCHETFPRLCNTNLSIRRRRVENGYPPTVVSLTLHLSDLSYYYSSSFTHCNRGRRTCYYVCRHVYDEKREQRGVSFQRCPIVILGYFFFGYKFSRLCRTVGGWRRRSRHFRVASFSIYQSAASSLAAPPVGLLWKDQIVCN